MLAAEYDALASRLETDDGTGFAAAAAVGDTVGYVVFDRFVCDRACGGLRILCDVTVDELREQAGSMTRKFAFLGIACGGAKAGIVERPDWSDDARRRALEDFGAAFAPLLRRGIFVLGEDMGCRPGDLAHVSLGAGLGGMRRAPNQTERGSGYWAGLSTAVATAAALEQVGCRVAGARVAVEGFGRVGATAAHELTRRGACLRAVSNAYGAIVGDALSSHALAEFLRTHGEHAIARFPGARPIPRPELFAEPVDALVPCARQEAIHAGNAAALRCRVIVPGANVPLAPGLDAVLHARGILVVPDFVANAGGVLVGHVSSFAPRHETATWLVRGWFADVVRRLLTDAAAQSQTPTTVARRHARRNLSRLAVLRRPPAHERLLARLGGSRLRRLLPLAAERSLLRAVFRTAA